MINLELEFSHGKLQCISSSGHAQPYNGVSIPCAIVSAALKHFGMAVSARSGVELHGTSRGPGHLEIEIRGVAPSSEEWFQGAVDVLYSLLIGASSEFPQEVHLDEIHR
ncbi:ribosomal-processing cysteine protease Prp [Spirochaeta lutea]|uniref:Uncharacterized protein n=1 Tax=Spirochaeta lutea TaxID=1480694 RepID=A0A098R1N1_9SPIO|nr:ribosomal-processing cysteine protease Prp [Spirochaeta lutea]KGE73859.1 hypothetical protein DC28_01230 [Spirochaeta lutea]